VVFKGFERLQRGSTNLVAGEKILLQKLRTSPKASGFQLKLILPAGTHLNPLANSRWQATPIDARALKLKSSPRELTELNVTVPWEILPGQTTLTSLNLDLDLYYCAESNAGLCYFRSVRLILPVEVAAAGTLTPVVEFRVER
jgi:hypothetical protein